MMVLYAVAGDLTHLGIPEGFSAHRAGRISVLYTETVGRPRLTQAELLAYGRRINVLSRSYVVIPMPFDTCVESRKQLTELATRNEEEWTRRLEEVDSYCELLVHLTDTRAPLHSRAAASRRRERLVAELRDLVSVWTKEGQTLPGPSARVALLVPRGEAQDVSRTIHDWADERGDVEVAVTGPWPPFSFCPPPEALSASLTPEIRGRW
jgi:hypothetical protein